MADSASDKYRIVLGKVPEEDQPAVALALSGCFSLPPASTRGIAASAPIALLSDISRVKAEAVLAELQPSLPEAVTLRIAGPDDDEQISRLQWPRPPRIYGRNLAEFDPVPDNQDINCPLCGELIRIHVEHGVFRASAARPDKRSTRRIVPADDKDPLFSGIKPLATGASNFASLRSLEAGDTGFWMDYSREANDPPAFPPQRGESRRSGETSHAKKSTGKLSAGLAAFMKPGVFAVVVGRTRDPQAVKMIAEILGVGEDEARDRCLNLGLCVARDISLDEAQNLLTRFRTLGAKARIVKPM